MKSNSISPTKQLIHYANDFVNSMEICSINPYDTKWYSGITKARKKYQKRFEYDHFDDAQIDSAEILREFAISFISIPDDLFGLMERMKWIHIDSKEPLISKDKFYGSRWRNDNRETITEWFIDFDKYVELLLINDDLRQWYSPDILKPELDNRIARSI